VELVDYAGDRVVYGFRGLTQGALKPAQVDKKKAD
jgi:urease beta subunit